MIEDCLLGPKTVVVINVVDVSDLLLVLKSEPVGCYCSFAVGNPKQRKILKS